MSKGAPGPGIIILTLLFLAIHFFLQKLQGIRIVKENWPKVRCRPDIMFFANIYGFDASENIEFCLKRGFDFKAGAFIKPFYSFLSIFANTIITLIQSLNSIRMTFATLIGSVNTMFQNFYDRITQLFFKIQVSIIRIRFLMSRINGTMYAIIYMAMSGMTAVTNFSNTFLFKFLDTFCFAPETLVDIQGRGQIPIRDVRIGDRFAKTGSRVTGTFQISADGQSMCLLPGTSSSSPIQVSTNHYVLGPSNTWIFSKDHPSSSAVTFDWSGGHSRPLICLNTSDHRIPIGECIFRDYDETSEADIPTMIFVSRTLNGTTPSTSPTTPTATYPYDTCVAPSTMIRMKDRSVKTAASICLGDELSSGTVHGIVLKECESVVILPSGETITSGCLLWNQPTNSWIRAGELYPIITFAHSRPFYSFIITPSAVLELEDSTILRDYVELHAPETKDIYGDCLRAEPCC